MYKNVLNVFFQLAVDKEIDKVYIERCNLNISPFSDIVKRIFIYYIYIRIIILGEYHKSIKDYNDYEQFKYCVNTICVYNENGLSDRKMIDQKIVFLSDTIIL